MVAVQVDDRHILLEPGLPLMMCSGPAGTLVPEQARHVAADHQVGLAVAVQVADAFAPDLGRPVRVDLEVMHTDRRGHGEGWGQENHRKYCQQTIGPKPTPCATGKHEQWRPRVSWLAGVGRVRAAAACRLRFNHVKVHMGVLHSCC